MKACRNSRQRIALLALQKPSSENAATSEPSPEEQALRAHFEHCDRCREYWNELSALAGRLASAKDQRAEFSVSEPFHRRVLRALHSAAPGRQPEPRPQPHWLSWRIAWPVAGAGLIAVAALVANLQNHKPTSIARTEVVPAAAEQPPPPLASEYLLTANRSLEQLDDLLTRQAKVNLPPAPPLTLFTVLGEQ